MKYVIKYDESIIDVSVKLYGTPTYVFDLIELNPILLDVNNTSIVGLEIYYNEIIFIPNEVITNTKKEVTKNVTIGDYQSVFDLSLQLYGSLEKVFDVLKLANISDLTIINNAGITFNYDYIPLKFPKYFNENGIKLATKYPLTITDNWILRDGTWDDTGVWDDTKTWID